MLVELPECVSYTWTPCGESDWEQCDRCGKLVCRIHSDGLYTVRHSGTNPNRGSDRICGECIESAYGMGEISRGQEYEYINLR
jgi:hypothetical protein